MINYKTKIEGHGEQVFNFDCHENTEPIIIGDPYLFFFAGTADVTVCQSAKEMAEVNKNNRVKDNTKIDLVTGFWNRCYKIKSTDFDLTKI